MHRIYQLICDIMGDILSLHPDEINPKTDVSHLTYQEMAAAAIACEKTFHIEMEDERIGQLKSISDWMNYVQERIKDQKEDRPAPSDAERESWYYE